MIVHDDRCHYNPNTRELYTYRECLVGDARFVIYATLAEGMALRDADDKPKAKAPRKKKVADPATPEPTAEELAALLAGVDDGEAHNS